MSKHDPLSPKNQKTETSNVIEEIQITDFSDALSERYLSYALSTIMSRSLPDVRDGLKPVQRRLLYAMRLLKLDPKSAYKKSARVVGDVIGKYHPHGDQSIYDALVRLAQSFSQRYPMIDGQGNFGNIDGDNAAAMRYTEARLTFISQLMLDGLDENTVDFRPTYDGAEEEPVVLPARFPNLLANGTQGIAVGMATSVPPHNLTELCKALIALIKDPDITIANLLKRIPGPDLPTGGIIVEDSSTIENIYSTGRGSLRLRARWYKESLKNGTYQIVITEIPYQVTKSKLIERIADLISTKKLPMIVDIHDESTEDVRLILEPRTRNSDADMIMEALYKSCDLETRINYNMNILDAQQVPQVMNLKEILYSFLGHRREILRRRTTFRADKIKHRIEILEGFLIVYLNLDEVIRIVREEDDPKKELIKTFTLTDVQAESVLNMRLRALRKLEEMEIRREHDTLSKELTDLNSLLKEPSLQWGKIKDDLDSIIAQINKIPELKERRTEIAGAPMDIEISSDAFIEKEPITVLLSQQGWIRAAKGHSVALEDSKFKEGDEGAFSINAYTTDKILLFGTNGRFYTIPADKLPGGRGYGEPVRLSIDLPNEEKILKLLVDSAQEQRFLIAADDGRGFIVHSKDLLASTRSGKQVLNIQEGVRPKVFIPIEEGADSVCVVGTNRKVLIFPLGDLPEMTKGRGVMLQRYKGGQLSDSKTFKLEDGLSWQWGEGRIRTEHDTLPWQSKRASAGRLAPSGFPRNNQFSKEVL